MIIKVRTQQLIGSEHSLAIRCPGCGNYGTFLEVGLQDLSVGNSYVVGMRRCPYSSCRTLVIYIRENSKLIQTFPSLRIDFDHTNIPDRIIATLDEAITDHANQCYVSSAIMVRKTLELLCLDRGAVGKDLKQRIASLRDKIVMPEELLVAMDGLRLLGNDAAHIESQVYNSVGQEEVEVAIELTKEVLKAIYQYSSLVAKLEALKRIPSE